MSTASLPVLMYHAVHNQRSPISVTPQDFRQHMRWLKEGGFQVLSTGALVKILRQGSSLPSNSLVLTFDDGLECLYWNVYPVLREFGFTATVFLVSGYCGRLNNWPGQPDGIPSLKLLNWEQIREMDEDGIEFGAHSVSHPRLDRLSQVEVEIELTESKLEIEQHLGHEVEVFAYPYGSYDTYVQELAAQIFLGACGTELGYVNTESDPFTLNRIDVYYFQRPVLFRSLFSLSGSFFTRVLRGYRKIRASGDELNRY